MEEEQALMEEAESFAPQAQQVYSPPQFGTPFKTPQINHYTNPISEDILWMRSRDCKKLLMTS
jgi:hypothetical protein